MASESSRIGFSGWVGILAALVGISTGAAGVAFSLASQHAEDTQRARDARAEVVGFTLQMAEYDRTLGTKAQGEITALGAEAYELIDEFGPSTLRLSPTIYREMGQYLSFSTTDLDLAARMEQLALDNASDNVLEQIYAHRVLADIAVQVGQVPRVIDEYDSALTLGDRLRTDNAYLAGQAQNYTRAYRALSLWLGAQRYAGQPDIHQAFCDAADARPDDYTLLASMVGLSSLVQRQMTRLGLAATAAGFAKGQGICAP